MKTCFAPMVTLAISLARFLFSFTAFCLVAVVVCTWGWSGVQAADCLLPLFQPVRNRDVGPFDYAGWVAVDDFNRDGKPDMAVTTGDNGHVAIYLGDGTGSFSAPSILPAGSRSVAVSTGDFNQDRQPDLVVGSGDGTLIYFGDGTGGFSAPITLLDGGDSLGAPYDIAVSDFNQDGKLDLAIAHNNTGLDVLLGNGSGGFSAPVEYIAGSAPSHVSVADFNNDGKTDLVTGNEGTGNVSILIGDGLGGFSVNNIAITPSEFGIGDFNGDTKTDLVVGYADNPLLLLGDGLGGFTTSSSFPTGGSGTSQLRSADFNGDGKTDIAVFNKESEDVEILLGDGAGGLTLEATLPVGRYEIHELVIADLNTDGKPDILLPNSYYGNVSILINNGADTVDTAPPVISVVNSRVDAVGPTGAEVSYSVSALDNSGRVASLSCDIPSGSLFPIGTTPLTCTAADYCGNSGSQSFNLTVVDQPPVLSLPNAIQSGAACPSGKVVNYTATAMDAISGDLPVSCNPASGSIFPIGQTTVTCSATDGGGHTSTGIFVVNVINGPVTTFEAPRHFSNGSTTVRVAIADFNNDHNSDIAATAHDASYVGVFLGDGTGNFSEPIILPAGSFSVPVSAGDFNNDGNQDLAVGSNDGTVWIYLGDGAGGFGLAAQYADGDGEAYEMAVDDFDHDGNLDLAVGHQFAGLAIMLGNGSGGFSLLNAYISDLGPTTVAKADFNNDGNTDLITANSQGGNVSLLLGDGEGGFAVSTPSIPATGFGIGDFDSDGNIDVVSGNSDGVSVLLFPGDGNGGFGAPTSFHSSNSGGPEAADLNGDGHLDIAVTNGSTNEVSVILGDGAGGFGPPSTFSTGDGPGDVSVADFNNDGKPDIAMPNYYGADVTVMLNSTEATPESGCDQISPSTTATPSASPSIAGWNNSDVTVTFSASDESGGSGVKEITYSASGAQNVPSTTVIGSSGSVSITAEGQTTLSFFARDNAGNIELPKTLTVKLDKHAPTATISSPATNGNYLLNQVVTASYACTDAGSGMASCVGQVASGSAVDTTSPGIKTFNVTATDLSGNSGTTTTTFTVRQPLLGTLGPAALWVGLKNSDDVGTKFDLLAEVFKNGAVIGSGQVNDVLGGSSGFNNARLDAINLALSQPTGVGPGDTLSIRLSVRVAASSGHRSGTARLWFNDSAANSRFAATIEGVTNNYFLRNGSTLGNAAGSGPKNTIDVFVDRLAGGNPFKPFGTWSVTF